VTAYVRSPERLERLRERITVIRGDLLDRAETAAALRGQEAVVSAFGPRLPISKDDADLLQRFAAVLTDAMRSAGVCRLVIESTAFLFRDSLLPPAYLFGRLFFPGVVADASAMERIVRESGLDWTIVRPPQLTHGPFTGRSRIREGHLPLAGFNISRADVAACMVNAAEDRGSIGKVLGITR
jgi:putative NADH-flavin reductase